MWIYIIAYYYCCFSKETVDSGSYFFHAIVQSSVRSVFFFYNKVWSIAAILQGINPGFCMCWSVWGLRKLEIPGNSDLRKLYRWLVLELGSPRSQGNILWAAITISLCLLLNHGEILPHILLFGICGTMANLKFPHISLNPSLIHSVNVSADIYNLIAKNKVKKINLIYSYLSLLLPVAFELCEMLLGRQII